jgi:hypothetical protein
MELKFTPKTAYVLTKTNESLLKSQGLIEDFDYTIDDQGVIFNDAAFSSKAKLSNYLIN